MVKNQNSLVNVVVWENVIVFVPGQLQVIDSAEVLRWSGRQIRETNTVELSDSLIKLFIARILSCYSAANSGDIVEGVT